MTEEEWNNATEYVDLIESVHLSGERLLSNRKCRLFGVACCRRIWHVMPDELSRKATELAERLADEQASKREIDSVLAEFDEAYPTSHQLPGPQRWASSAAFVCLTQNSLRLASEAADHCATAVGDFSDPSRPRIDGDELKAQCDWIRDIYNPFATRVVKRKWRSSTVVALATGIYADRAFDRMPILADALEDAGCDHADVLAHCRGDGPHVRGCWVVDLILGKR